MNKIGKKSIEYSDISWNPYSGCLAQNCAVREENACWAEKMAKRQKGHNGYDQEDPFKPTFHLDKLEEPLHWTKKPRRVATCFMGDIAFAKPDWIRMILDIIKWTPKHRYYILTKQPQLLRPYKFPENVWLGVTVNCQVDIWRIVELSKLDAYLMFDSFEPLYEKLTLPFETKFMNWFVIGAQTHPVVQPKREWVEEILYYADLNRIPVFMKDNLQFEPKLLNFPLVDQGVTLEAYF